MRQPQRNAWAAPRLPLVWASAVAWLGVLGFSETVSTQTGRERAAPPPPLRAPAPGLAPGQAVRVRH